MTTPTVTETVRNGNPVGQRVELGRYTIRDEERVLYGQRVHGVVRVTDVPARGRYAEIAASAPSAATIVRAALGAFDHAIPDLLVMRNIGEHADEYGLDSHRRRVKSIDSRQLEVGTWNGQTYEWLGRRLNVDDALAAGEALFTAVQALRPPMAT